MANKSLRRLAKEFASGTINQEAYREARDNLLTGILNGEIPVEVVEFRPPIEVHDLDATVEKTTIRPQAEMAVKAASQPEVEPEKTVPDAVVANNPDITEKSGIPYLLISAIIIVISIIAVFSIINLSQEDKKVVVTDKSLIEEVTTVIVEDESSPEQPENTVAADLIEEFLKMNDWSDDSLQTFKDNWNNLSAEDQALGLASPLRAQLSNAIYQKLVEERALLGLGDSSDVIARQHTLVDFASALDLNDPRFKVEGEIP